MRTDSIVALNNEFNELPELQLSPKQAQTSCLPPKPAL